MSKPDAGTWTAVIYTASNAKYFGAVKFSYATEDFHTAGSVSPASQTLAPGQSGTFSVTATAGQAGDEALSLHLGTGSRPTGPSRSCCGHSCRSPAAAAPSPAP